MKYLIDHHQAAAVVGNIKVLIKKYCERNNINAIVIGLSGGLDSTVALGLVAPLKNDGINIVPLILPCESNPEDERLGRLAAKTFGVYPIKFDITPIYHSFIEATCYNTEMSHLNTHGGYPISNRDRGNVKARLRMACGTFFFANLYNGLVLSTDNLSEYWTGFWTIGGDVGHFGPIQNIWKGLEIPVIAGVLGAPDEIVKRPPTDGLGLTNTDKEQLFGLEYYDLDRVIIALLQNGFNPDTRNNADVYADERGKLPEVKGISDEIVGEVFNKMKATSFKRKHCSLGLSIPRKDLGLPEIDKIDLNKL